MALTNPLEAPPIRAASLPGHVDPTGELAAPAVDALADAEVAPADPVGERLKVEFVGSAAEYARLWYSNLFLTLITFGGYSAWATVSQRRYLASRTLIGGVPLVYHARPLPILKGRALALLIVSCAVMACALLPIAQPVLIASAILLAPWFLISTFTFTMANYSWRGVRFGYRARYVDAVKALLPLLVWPLAMLLSQLGVLDRVSALAAVLAPLLAYLALWPWSVAAVTRLRFGHAMYGCAQFKLDATASDFYQLYFRSFGWRFGLLVGAVAIGGAVLLHVGSVDVAAAAKLATVLLITAIGTGYARGRRVSLVLHRLTVGDAIRFRNGLSPEGLAAMYLRNAIWLLLSLGLASPWRKVATLRMRCERISVYVARPLSEIRSAKESTSAAFGESLAEGLRLDLSL